MSFDTPFNRDAHEVAECAMRMVHCPLKCGRQLSERDVDEHTKHECSHRVVECPMGCGTKTWASDVETHIKSCSRRFVVTDGPPDSFAGMVESARSMLELHAMRDLLRMQEARERQLLAQRWGGS